MLTACTGDDNQRWSIERQGDLYHIVSASRDHCLIATTSVGDGAAEVLEAACEIDADPQWVLFPMNQDITYEDAEDELTRGWRIYDDDPPGASFIDGFDETIQSQVIEFPGSGTENGFWLKNENDLGWGNFSHTSLYWDMQFAEFFVVYVDVRTTDGHRYLYYTPLDRDVLDEGESIHHGLGSSVLNGQWQTINRDLQADLHAAQPDVDLLEVNGFLIRGSGRIDNIKLHMEE